jgi:peptidoglycan hydrolase-like protein with peptidoglycan-binding domain
VPLTSPLRAFTVALLTGALVLLAAPPAAAVPPATPTGMPTTIEDLQPYVGQEICDPVAKPGVRAFSNLLLDTYRDTASSGIVRDCGSGGQSEHKEGRAWDWRVSVNNAAHVQHVNETLSWLFATDKNGHKYANLRRLGIMYVIWNKRIFKAYAADTGWQPYSGASPHTDHVHFSFGWNGAKQVTSFWDKTVAPIDYGPKGPQYPVIKPVAEPANLPVLATYGHLTIARGSSNAAAVKVIQKKLAITADGVFGSGTEGAVKAFQGQQRLTVTGKVAPADWLKLFPKPTSPFGKLERIDPDFANTRITGWAIDADKDAPINIEIAVDGLPPLTVSTDQSRPDVTKTYTKYPGTHGFKTTLPLTDGPHTICVKAINLSGTPGTSTLLECRKITVQHGPIGLLDPVLQGPEGVVAQGWAIDPDTADPVDVELTVNGAAIPDVIANLVRPGLATNFPEYGDRHGYRSVLTLPAGTHTVCATARNALETAGDPIAPLGCRDVTVVNNPVGVASVVSKPGAIAVTGKALDPDQAAPTQVEVTVDGVARPLLNADDVGTALTGWARYGQQRSFATDLVLPDGPHTVCVTARNATGTPGTSTKLGCSSVTAAHHAVGSFEALQVVPGGVLAKGWALDPDSAASSQFRLDVDGVVGQVQTAAVSRPDIAKHYPGYGDKHGFAPKLALADGTHRVCGRSVNTSGTTGSDKVLGCRSVTVKHSPQGLFDVLRRVPAGVNVSGWALDTDTDAPVTVQVTVDGKAVPPVTASRAGTVWKTAFPAFPSGHAYATTLKLAPGSHRVCLTAVNLSGTAGANAGLGCRSIVVSNSPTAVVKSVTRQSGYVTISGWAHDPDTTAPVSVRLKVDGQIVPVLRADQSSTAFAAAHPGYGTLHRFSKVLRLPRGKHTYCAQAYNAPGTPGYGGPVACRTITL